MTDSLSSIPLLKAWRHPLSATVGLAAIAVVLLWPTIPLRSLSVWLQTLTSKFPMNVLYPVYALAVGSYAALFTYDRKVAPCCRVGGRRLGVMPSVLGALLGACPACIPVVAAVLPLSVTTALGYYSWLILLTALLLTVGWLWWLGGFRPQVQRP